MKNDKILIYRLGSLGDTIIALPCFHLIRKQFPTAKLILLTNKPVVSKAAPIEAVLGDPGIGFYDEIISYPVGTRSPFLLLTLFFKIRLFNIKTLVNLTAARSRESAKRDRIFFRLCGIEKQYGTPKSEKDFETFKDVSTELYEWEAKRLSHRLVELGEIDFRLQNNWDLMFSAEEITDANYFFDSVQITPGILTICPGTKMQSKDWGESNWYALIQRLNDLVKGWTLLIVGAKDEFELGNRCLSSWAGPSLNLCGKVSPRVSAIVIKKSNLFIGHDSGPMHLAGAVGTPIVAIFSARDLPGRWYPRGENNQIIYHQTDCFGCYLEVCLAQEKKCILSIKVEEVYDAVKRTLAASKVK